MRSFAAHRRTFRFVGLVVFVLALSGPWGYDKIDVPAEFDCQRPFVRLYGDFCGLPISGLGMLVALGNAVGTLAQPGAFGAVEAGGLASMLLLAAGAIVILAPIAGLVWRLVGRDGKGLRLHAVWSVVALVVAVTLLAAQTPALLQLWGLWLYAAVTILVLAGEVAAIGKTTRDGLLTRA